MIVGEREKGGGWWVRGRGGRMVGERERGGGWWVRGRGGKMVGGRGPNGELIRISSKVITIQRKYKCYHGGLNLVEFRGHI